MLDFANALLGLSARAEDLTFTQMSLRALLMYLMVLTIVRVGKKRFLARATAFDAVLVIMVGAIAARAVTGGTAYFPAAASVAVLVALHWVISLACRHARWLGNLVKGHPTEVILNGNIIPSALARAHMSNDDLREDLRMQGVADPAAVREARIERNGKLSVIKQASDR